MTTTTITPALVTMKVKNAITGEVVMDNSKSPVSIADFDFDTMNANAEYFKECYPDCHVTFSASNGSFVCLMPLNQQRDECLVDRGLMTFEQYIEKWY